MNGALWSREAEHNSIVEELRSGFVLNDRLLRAARVSVAVDTSLDEPDAEPTKEELKLDLNLSLDDSDAQESDVLLLDPASEDEADE